MTERPPEAKRKSSTAFWRACRFLKPYRAQAAASVGLALLTGLFTAGGLATLVPLLNVLIEGQTVAQYAAEKSATWRAANTGELPPHLQLLERAGALVPTDPVWAVATVFGFVFVLAVCGSATRFFQELVSDTTAIRAVADVRRKLFDRALHLPLAHYVRHGTGDLTARLITDAQGLFEGYKAILGRAVQEPITASFALAVAVWIDWRLTALILVFAPVSMAIIRKLGTKVRRSARAALVDNAVVLGQVEATLAGVRLVKSSAAEPFERRRFRASVDRLAGLQRRTAVYEAWSGPVLELLAMLLGGAVLVYASVLVFRARSLDPAQLITLMMCLAAVAEPLRRISKLNSTIQKAGAAAGRILEVLETPAEPRRRAASVRVVGRELPTTLVVRDGVRFENVTFAYPNADRPALRNVTLDARAGQTVALVGRNGSGKTTLLNLLPRFFDPSAGGVLIDGVDVRDLPLRTLRRAVAVVAQDTTVFPGTVAENLAYARPQVPRAAIEAAARRAHAHQFIAALPAGYDTPLSGLGARLSGGQKQRLAIARAVLRDAPILVLDEATSQVDAESEGLIQRALAELAKGRTTFVIAHRFSTILDADVIAVMEDGELVATGRHDELLRGCATYRQLYERQLFAA